MTLLALAQYLFGSREAILRVARSPQALLLGLVFVLAAGFAREYDGEDLLREPGHLLIPLAASLASSLVLYLIVRGVAAIRGASEPLLWRGYLDFLGLYWMTAPLALLYAIPFERFLPAPDSVRANLWLLGLVAMWRVLLMTRVISVIYGTSFFAALMLVMFFADTIAAIILGATPLPIVSIMGGIRLSESEMVLHDTVWTLRVLTVLSWPVWAIGAVVVAARRKPRWHYVPATGQSQPVAIHLWTLGAAALLAWVFILPFTQPEQRLRKSVERDLRAGRIAEGLATMSAHERDDFPPHWDPPPRIGYREFTPDIVELQTQLQVIRVKPWVRELFDQKFGNSLRGETSGMGVWFDLSTEEVERRISAIERMPTRQELVRDYADGLEMRLKENNLPVDLQQRIAKLLQEAGILIEEPAQQNAQPGVEAGSP